MATFHEGELEVQRRAGVSEMARRVGQSIHDSIPPAAQEFLSRQIFVVLGGADDEGQMWASLLSGRPGFAWARDEVTLRIGTLPVEGDPLHASARDGAPVGLLAIEPATRRRMRLNGIVHRLSDGLLIEARQVYANCPKYIQKREMDLMPSNLATNALVQRGTKLSPDQTRFIERADTFFIASLAAESGADVSHRGGTPGFVRVETAGHLAFPDYSGNAMFNTLGNIQSDPRAGLLFVDWERGDTLQLSGRARVDWDTERARQFPGAERVVEFEIEDVVAIEGANSWHWDLVEASPYNP